ncbi:hydroxypyruvate reductase [Sulfuriferula plumbiphila]|uniref:Hydroxypyruvate reductase n=1 Tax=Sulfuriferula plumbiphila TaxID=171865 RepID=A0A512LBZ2_9PROT|nr:glycerate kinase [Sulfuriferula plumbiphila]BBP03321.1 hydroxypyruvate reductase [Sulfuriferula plumbiphila]GEP31912.1 hydroxypyruvate reductase [Sulfuriferula plumbiphila]
MQTAQARALLIASFHAALAGADPLRLVPPYLPAPPSGRTLVLGGGKAAASMACAVEAHWPDSAPLQGLVVTRYQHSLPTRRIAVIEASHPLPDGRGAETAQQMLARAATLTRNDLLLALISGGGSSLLALPVAGISLQALRRVTRALVNSGASIQDINTVRKHLTQLAGGQLARAAGAAQVRALILSDVTGDDPTHIASGPCCADPSTFGDALAILERFRIEADAAVHAYLRRGAKGEIADTPKPGDTCFARTENRVIGGARQMLRAAVDYFQTQGVTATIVNEAETQSSQQVAQIHVHRVRQILANSGAARPLVLLSGGETTVATQGSGRGGRNAEYLLALAIELHGMDAIYALAADTDGIDGTENNAGALIGPDTLSRAQALGLNPARLLASHDSHTCFAALGDLLVTGPTRTNVNDYRAILIA